MLSGDGPYQSHDGAGADGCSSRGHEVVIFGIADTEERVRARGSSSSGSGIEDYPAWHPAESWTRGLGETERAGDVPLHGRTREEYGAHDFARWAGGGSAGKVDALLVDEADMGGNVADILDCRLFRSRFFRR